VIGGKGQLGSALKKALELRNFEYISLSSSELDIRNKEQVLSRISELKPRVVINAAAWTDVDGAEKNPEGAFSVNVTGAANLAIASKIVGAKYVYISTDYVFSGDTNKPLKVNELLAPKSVYGRTKAEGENSVLNLYPEHSYIFRTAWLYSQLGKNFAKTITRLALTSQELVSVVTDQFGQPTSALDLANQIIDAITNILPFGIYHATNSGECSWFDFAQAIFEFNNVSTSRLAPILSSEIKRDAVRPKYSVLDHSAWKVIPPMRDWRIALEQVMPDIVATVNKESSNA
jgi:dTDP-4-dehydrorhamnose reductase